MKVGRTKQRGLPTLPLATQRVWHSMGIRGILSTIVMRSEQENLQGEFSPGTRRYTAQAIRETKSSGFFSPAKPTAKESFARAIRELSAEDEELSLPDEQSPVVFKDGIFQIDISNSSSPPAIDPALKGLIDSILGS